MIQVIGVTMVFKEPNSNSEINALRGIDFVVEKGDLVGIIGPSGAGKTTLLSIIGGLLDPTSGEILINGISIPDLSGKELAIFRRENIGYLWQLPKDNLISGISLLKNVMLPLQIANKPREEQITRSNELLDRLGLVHRKNHLPNQVSGGEAQRAAVAVALANNPAVLLGDQITGELDTKNSVEVINHLKELKDELGTTMVIATHRKEFIQSTDYSLILNDGKIAEVVSNQQIPPIVKEETKKEKVK